jgi:hypothetical protein
MLSDKYFHKLSYEGILPVKSLSALLKGIRGFQKKERMWKMRNHLVMQ